MADTERSSGPGVGVIAVILVAAAVAIGVAIWRSKPKPEGGGKTNTTEASAESLERLRLHRVALAATDNLKTDPAEVAWSELYQETPTNSSVTLNRALNRVLKVDALTEKATDASASPEEQRAARQQLPDGISGARTAIDDYLKSKGNATIATWLKTRVDLHEASLLPRSMTKSLRREIFDRLVKTINEVAESSANEASDNTKADQLILLAGPLTQVIDLLEDPIDGVPKEIAGPGAVALTQLSELRPENLYLAIRAARLAISQQSKDAEKLIRRTQSLARSIEPSLRRQTAPIGKTPDELVDEMAGSVQSGDFSNAENQMLLWFNLLNATELIKTDRRRSSPHPLDLLSFESMREVASQVAKANPVDSTASELAFQVKTIGPESTASKTVAMTAIDADLDLDVDLVELREVSGGESSQLLLHVNQGESKWASVGPVDLPGDWTGLLVADLFMVDSSSPGRLREDSSANRHNTLRSVIVFGPTGAKLVVVDGRGTKEGELPEANDALKPSEDEIGLEELEGVVAMATGDLEGDGDLDLVASTTAGLRVLVNRGNRTFFTLPDNAIGGGDMLGVEDGKLADPPVALAIVDLDRDLDLDLVTVQRGSGTVGWIENLLHLQFRFAPLSGVDSVPGADSIAIEDFDGNVSWDVLVGTPEAGTVIYSQTADAGQWRVDTTKTFSWNGSSGDDAATNADATSPMVVADLDNDSYFECIRSDQGSNPEAIQLGAADMPRQPLRLESPGLAAWLSDDLDGDLLPDLAGQVSSDELSSNAAVAINQSKSVGKPITVRFKGIDDNNANSGRVNHYAVGSVLELRFGPHYRSRIIREPVTHFGLDGIEEEANLRVIFPSGLTQTIADVKPGALLEEEQTLKGSCPYLYTYNGTEFEFVTDCLWAAPLGLQVKPGVVVPDRPWEYLKIDGKHLAANDGTYNLRITEELWEIAYFDHLALTAVDHPQNVVIFTNEKVGPPSIAEPKIHAFENEKLRPIHKASDTHGNDVTELLAKVDRKHVQGFERRYRQGLCPTHWIELDLTDHLAATNENATRQRGIEPQPARSVSDDTQVQLVLTGWILPTDTSLNIQIDQNPELDSPEPPSLWVPDSTSESGWRRADPYIGFPGGKNKSIVVDVTEHVNMNDPRVRVQTTAQIYWDQACVSVRTTSEAERVESQVQTHPLTLSSAEVAWHGFSRRIKPGPMQAEVYDYQNATDSPRWPPLSGELTRFGDVSDLLSEWDDRMVVISGGDEVRLRFAVEPKSEALRRDFVLHGVGWDKDADLNTLCGQSSLPLPSKNMTSYPPKLTEVESAEIVRQINQGHLTRQQSFREFWARTK